MTDAPLPKPDNADAYRVLFELSPLPKLIFDPDNFAMLDANNAALDLYGYDRAAFKQLHLRDLRAVPLTPEEVTEIRESKPNDVWSGTVCHKTSRGERIWLEVSARPVHIGGQAVRLASLANVTERRALEDQLRQAQKMEGIGRMAAGIAHEFNNAMSVILGCAGLMRMELPADHPSLLELAEIEQAGRRAVNLTRQLLTFSRQKTTAPLPMVVNNQVETATRILARLVGDAIRIVPTLRSVDGTVLMEPDQFDQVLMNLVLNARDAMPLGGTIAISTDDVTLDEGYARRNLDVKPGLFVRLRVADTGTGMRGEVKARIFDPFFTTKPMGEGTGLGLAVVFGIVRQSGGHVTVESELATGSVFDVYLPHVDARTHSLPG